LTHPSFAGSEQAGAQVAGPDDRHVVRLPLAVPTPWARDTRRAELLLLGGFRLTIAGSMITIGLVGQRLLALLACRGGTVPRSQVAHAMWPDVTNARAHANLRTAVYRMERCCPGLLDVSGGYLRPTEELWIDLVWTARLARDIVTGTGPLPNNVIGEVLRTNWYDDLLPDWDAEWLDEYQGRYRQLRLSALETLSMRLAASGNHGAAVQTALAAVQADELRDSAHETLIRACLAQGNRYEAQTHFARYQQIFREELGVEPAGSIGQLLHSA
jgi:DNA-binding SARP family transcriptional activator